MCPNCTGSIKWPNPLWLTTISPIQQTLHTVWFIHNASTHPDIKHECISKFNIIFKNNISLICPNFKAHNHLLFYHKLCEQYGNAELPVLFAPILLLLLITIPDIDKLHHIKTVCLLLHCIVPGYSYCLLLSSAKGRSIHWQAFGEHP